MEYYFDIAPKILLWAAVIITLAPFIVVLGAFLLFTCIFIYAYIGYAEYPAGERS